MATTRNKTFIIFWQRFSIFPIVISVAQMWHKWPAKTPITHPGPDRTQQFPLSVSCANMRSRNGEVKGSEGTKDFGTTPIRIFRYHDYIPARKIGFLLLLIKFFLLWRVLADAFQSISNICCYIYNDLSVILPNSRVSNYVYEFKPN